MTVLTSERMVLRVLDPSDLDELFALHNDPEVMHYIDLGAGESRAQVAELLDASGFWAAVERATGRFLGWFHFRPGHGAGPLEPELGYRLHRFAWGQGFATEGSQALIDHGFVDLGVERVYAETMAVHTASRRVMEKCGMRLVREFVADWPVRIPGDEHGDVEYAITRQEWEARRARSSGTSPDAGPRSR